MSDVSKTNQEEVNLGRRRALVQAGWAVPAVLAVGLTRSAHATKFYRDHRGKKRDGKKFGKKFNRKKKAV